METLGSTIARNREKLKLSQQQLSDCTGISRSYLSDIENNRYLPSLKTLMRLAGELHLNFNFLLENDGNTSKHENSTESGGTTYGQH